MSEQWTAKETRVYTGDGGFDIRDLPNAAERAALIVKAVNNHADLVKALHQIEATTSSIWAASIARDALQAIEYPGIPVGRPLTSPEGK